MADGGGEPKALSDVPDREFTVVRYPGHVVTLARAADTLGGAENVLRAINKGKQVELRPVPPEQDPFVRPLFGDVMSTTGLVLRCSPQADGSTSCEVMGSVKREVFFVGLADFALPLHPHVVVPEKAGEQDEKKIPEMLPDLRLAPPLISRFDYPRMYRFRDNMMVVPLKKQKERRVKVATRTLLAFNVPSVPARPPPGSDMESIEVHRLPLVQTIKRQFLTRFVWSYEALLKVIPARFHSQLYRYLPAVAYRFSAGPWRQLWIRYEYDPRKEPNARFWQGIDFRVPPDMHAKLSKIMPSASGTHSRSATVGVPHLSSYFALLEAPPSDAAAGGSSGSKATAVDSEHEGEGEDKGGVTEGEEASDEGPSTGRPTRDGDVNFIRPPRTRIARYQLCDIAGHEIQGLLKAARPSVTCTYERGWFNANTIHSLRNYMHERLKKWVEEGPSSWDLSRMSASQLQVHEEAGGMRPVPPEREVGEGEEGSKGSDRTVRRREDALHEGSAKRARRAPPAVGEEEEEEEEEDMHERDEKGKQQPTTRKDDSFRHLVRTIRHIYESKRNFDQEQNNEEYEEDDDGAEAREESEGGDEDDGEEEEEEEGFRLLDQ